MTLAVKIFNKLDLKGHDPRYTEMKLTFAPVPGNLTKNLLTYYGPQSDRPKDEDFSDINNITYLGCWKSFIFFIEILCQFLH